MHANRIFTETDKSTPLQSMDRAVSQPLPLISI